MGYVDDFAAAQDPRVISQVTAAIHAYAETAHSSFGQDDPRRTYATKIANNLVALNTLILSACSFGSLTASTDDTTVGNVVATLWSMWAGE